MDNIYRILRETALKDGRISDDEAKMLDSIIGELNNYTKILKDAWKDGIISDDERADLSAWRKRVWDHTVKVALGDNIINTDEHDLLLSLVKVMKLLEEKE